MRSLFVVALPRSLSTLVHGCAAKALGLRSPAWTSAGEILNPDRFLFGGGRGRGGHGSRFVLPSAQRRFAMLGELLDDAIAREDAAYKDVLQPFAISDWLGTRDGAVQGLAVLRIRRPVADVALAMKNRGWFFPADAADSPFGDPEDRLLRGLLRAAAALDRIPAEIVEFDDLVTEESTLHKALRRLYPAVDEVPLSFFDAAFRCRAHEVLARRTTAPWRELNARAKALSLALSTSGPPP